MRDELISQFIDDELDLDEKIEFVQAVQRGGDFGATAVELLAQEKLLRAVPKAPAVRAPWNAGPWLKGLAAAAVAIAALWLGWPAQQPELAAQRFVIYAPQASRVEIIGSFSDFKPLRMQPAGGYWVANLKLAPGEYRYSFRVDGSQDLPDPTVASREQDDFGGANTIINLGGSI
ncbi:MAG: hypothetical protein BWY87_00320 [Deltaproteobacteria bacterium ADurb.Bin510]|nr:MAG: hypothetical protein BWY87_00320 [Deltaproteobacteria bacterium ADurb.Bin510]